jgi:hypothetical protein
MVGCRHGVKNTLVKNYLWFAERLGVRIDAERTVTDVRPLDAADGAEGYVVEHVHSGALRRGRGERITARGVVLDFERANTIRESATPTPAKPNRSSDLQQRLVDATLPLVTRTEAPGPAGWRIPPTSPSSPPAACSPGRSPI